MPADDLIERLDLELQAAVAPLAKLVKELDEVIVEHETELSLLREQRRNVKRVLGTLAPPPKPPAAKPKQRSQDRVEKKDRVREHLLRYGPTQDITADSLKANGLGDPPISIGMLYELLRELRDEGALRLDRQAQGGQSVYRRVAP